MIQVKVVQIDSTAGMHNVMIVARKLHTRAKFPESANQPAAVQATGTIVPVGVKTIFELAEDDAGWPATSCARNVPVGSDSSPLDILPVHVMTIPIQVRRGLQWCRAARIHPSEACAAVTFYMDGGNVRRRFVDCFFHRQLQSNSRRRGDPSQFPSSRKVRTPASSMPANSTLPP